MKNLIVIDGKVIEVTSINTFGYGYDIELDNGAEYKIFSDREAAAAAAEEYWRDISENDPDEFLFIVGAENLKAWALGEWAGPGNEKVRSLEDWFVLCGEYPEEQWASYDSIEIDDIKINNNLAEAVGIEIHDKAAVVIYRTN